MFHLIALFVLLFYSPGTLADTPPPDGIRVPVTEFVSPKLLEGTGYSLQDEALILRSVATFTLETPAGTTTVVGSVSLGERINEIRAVATLEEMKKSDVYKDALKNSARGPVEASIGNINGVSGVIGRPENSLRFWGVGSNWSSRK